MLAGLALCLPAVLEAQSLTVLDGVYTDAQARRGSTHYRRICSECHEGAEPDAERIIGHEFIERWREAPLGYLHGFISENMPGYEPGTLSEAAYLEVVA